MGRHTYERYTYERCTYERHAYKMHAYEMHNHGMHACGIHAQRKPVREMSIAYTSLSQYSYRTQVSASFKLFAMIIGPLIGHGRQYIVC
jgi:hypothetical protein